MKNPRYLILGMLAGALLSHAAQAATVLVGAGAQSRWQYLDAGTAAAPDWQRTVSDGARWKSGAAPLGYGHPGNTSTISFGRAPQAKPITAYFRREVDVADPARVATLVVDLRRDDGAVVYWNGVELLRSNMPPGTIAPHTLASTRIDGGREIEYQRFVLPAAGLPVRRGANLLAVEIHQVAPDSSDAVFDLALTAYGAGEALPADRYPAAYAALFGGDADTALALILQADPARAGFVQLALQACDDFLARGGSTGDARYWRLLDQARSAAPDDMDVVYAWLRAHVDARKELPLQVARRALPAAVDERWRFIADTPDASAGPLLLRRELLADVDDLELILENCYAYLERNGADYRNALDALRASITTDLNAATFAHRVARLLTIFGDPHSRLPDESEARLPVRFVMDGARVAVLKFDRSALLDPAHPYVTAINGRPVAQWLAAAERIVSQASPQYRRALALAQLRRLGVVARQLALPSADFALTLASHDGADSRRQVLALAAHSPPAPAPGPRTRPNCAPTTSAICASRRCATTAPSSISWTTGWTSSAARAA